jgi:PAS domain S-box-containing protein
MAVNQDFKNKTIDILVVDDEIANLRLMTDILTRAGYQVRSAEEPGIAIESALTLPPALILLDVMMPEMDGFEVCQRLKEHESTRDIPVIFISALQEIEHRTRGFEVGGVDFISKPYQKLEVLARMKTHLQLREMQLNLETLVAERTAELKKSTELLEKEIQQRKIAQGALVKSEQKYRTVVEQSTEGILIVQGDQRVYYNPAWLEMTGYSAAEYAPISFLSLVHTDDLESVNTAYQNLYAGQDIGPIADFRIITKSGEIKWLMIRGTRIDWEGKPAGMVFIQDVTERKQMEEAIIESEERYRGLSEAAFEAIFISEKGVCLEQNSTAEKMFGYTLLEAIGRKGTEWIASEDREMVMNKMLSGYEGPYEASALRKDGSTFLAEIQGRMTHYKGRTVRVTALRDISERKQAEAALQASEEQFRQLVEQSPLSIQIVAPDGRITMANRAFMKLWGVSDDALPEVLAKYNLLEDEEAKKKGVMPLIKKAFKGEAVVLPEIEYDADGTMDSIGVDTKANKRWIQVRLYPLKDANGEVVSVVDIEEDITERKQDEQQILEYQDKLKALASQLTIAEERERRRIASDLHDEVGQTLAFARMRLASARKTTADPKLQAILDEVSESLRNAIEDTEVLVFDLSSPILHEIGLGAAISEWVEQQLQNVYELEISFTEKGPKTALNEDINVILFRNVRELLTNVIRHANASQVSVHIEHAEDIISVIIEDDGVGFDPDATAQKRGREAGFGLFSIQERMSDMGGTFEIQSAPVRGSKAILSLPLTN